MTPFHVLLAWALTRLNAHPLVPHRTAIYALKAAILHRFDMSDGEDWQHIVHRCWH